MLTRRLLALINRIRALTKLFSAGKMQKSVSSALKPAVTVTVICLLLGSATISAAEGIGGYAEYNYSLLDTKMTDTIGTTKTKSSSLNQRYSLTLDKNVFPTLRFSGMGNYETNSSDNETNGATVTSESSRINTNADLLYTNGVFNGGAGFSRRQEASKTNGSSSSTLFFDSYNARFGWRPENFPTLDLLYSTFSNYDEHRTSQDNTSTTTILSSRYKPHETVDMSYSANYSTLNSRLAGLESQSLSQSLRTAYSDTFFKSRIAVSSSYNIATQDTKTQSRTGFADEQASNIFNYYVRTDNNIFPITSLSHTIDATTFPPPLIKISTDIPSGIALTFNSSTATTTPTYSDHLGLQFIANSTSINKIRVVVKADYSNSIPHISSLPDALVHFFSSSWKVFSSNDGTVWNRVTGVGDFARDPNFSSLDGSEAIEANFPTIATRYIKIVVTPVNINALSSSVSTVTFSSLQAFATTSIPASGKTSSQISGLLNMNLKARLLNIPAIFYDIGFNLDHTKSDSQAFSYRYTVINGLSLNHRFTSTLSTSARAAREDTVDPTAGARSSNSASISLSSQTLPTLTQSATYGFREEKDSGTTRTSHSINLSNSAELYRGISLSLSGGGNTVTDSSGANQKNLTVTGGLNLTPHKALSINLSASDSESWSSGGGKPDTSSATQTGELTVTLSPIPAVFLFGSYTINAQTGRKTLTAQSIGGSWSPFRGGALLLNTSYRENIDNSGNKDSTIVQSLRWNIRSGWYLDVSYLISTNTVTSQTTDTQVFNTALRLSF